MKIFDLTQDYKPIPVFRKVADKEIHQMYSTVKYDVEVFYNGSVFYGPSFYTISIKNKVGTIIWNGGEAIFLDTFFNSDFLSDNFDRVILIRVNDTSVSNRMQIILVDLKTGKEEVLTEEGSYSKAGHLLSFDAVYFTSQKVIECIDFTLNRKFDLDVTFKKYFKEIIAWGSCPVKNCIVIITKADEHTIFLFNVHEQRIEDKCTLTRESADHSSVNIGWIDKESLLLSISYSNKGENGFLMDARTDYLKLSF